MTTRAETPDTDPPEQDQVGAGDLDDPGPSRTSLRTKTKGLLVDFAYLAMDGLEKLIELGIRLNSDWKENANERRLERRERLVVGAVTGILATPEFYHSMRVHGGSSTFVLSYIKEREDEILMHYAALYEDLRQGSKKIIAYTPPGALGLWLFGNALRDKWHENDRSAPGTFPSTAWLQKTLDTLGDPGLVATSLVAIFVLISMTAGLFKDAIDHRKAYVRVKMELREAILPHVRVAMNIWSDKHSPTALRFDQAPALSSATDDRYLIDRDELKRIQTLVSELGASAVAISGPRGAGKSTLLRSLTTPQAAPRNLVVSLDAPASYDAKEFVIALYRQLCERVRERLSGMVDARWKRVSRGILNAIRILVALASIFLILIQVRPDAISILPIRVDPIPLPKNIWQMASYLALFAVVFTLAGSLRPHKGRTGAAELVRRSIEEEKALRFLQTISVERSGGLKAKVGFELGRKNTRQLIEQVASLPDLIRAYRSFAADSILWWRESLYDGNLVVIIDELDRVTDVESAERFINDIKGIFGILHCTYLVTVSEDALAQFERRMVGIRPVLDSTFDEVVRLPVLNISQAKELLGRRLVGFPQAFVTLCHALSGGIPRDLIRTARALIDARRRLDQDDLVPLTYEIVHQEIRRLKSGLIGRVNSELTGEAAFDLLKVLADPDWPELESESVLAAANTALRPDADRPANRVSMQLGVALYYYATILQVFEAFEPQHPEDSARLADLGLRLAVARSVMPTSVDLAYVHVQRLRIQEGLG
ncbi:ATP-binding protein [Plantactinospora mayteni]|uniref:KAP NTPase domain-containing protein n=1 Tax=Plantactinospora mayteni TaxID=566021 RepID=A0ABQ4EU41_9ACTN|nr:ATP-binding protein [Plantactinospora mayteni]GIG98177.1 hypothetical protein Pma05_47500 [Plantactinospora mayteni]